MNNFRISTEGIPHYENCPQCNGFGFENGHPASLKDAEDYVWDEWGWEELRPCDVCGSTIEGLPKEEK